MVVDINAVRQARLGDKDSFAKVYQQIAEDLYRVALYSLGNSHDAQDVVSETFIEAYKGIRKLRDENSFKPWIMRILSIRCKRKIGQYINGRNQLDIDDFLDLSEEGDGVEAQSTQKIALLRWKPSMHRNGRLSRLRWCRDIPYGKPPKSSVRLRERLAPSCTAL